MIHFSLQPQLSGVYLMGSSLSLSPEHQLPTRAEKDHHQRKDTETENGEKIALQCPFVLKKLHGELTTEGIDVTLKIVNF